MRNAINWFEIPVKDFSRAKTFYETILQVKIEVSPTSRKERKEGYFPSEVTSGGVGGSLVEGEGYEPSQKGTLIYLNAGDDLSVALAKVEKAGGSIILPKTSIGPNGFIGFFIDTEGNKVAIHSMK
jgi:predicted enzyme related to lactoylglutathione lyase